MFGWIRFSSQQCLFMNKTSHKNQPRATRVEIRELCDVVRPIMNELHGMSASSRFWAIVLGDHLKSSLNRRGHLTSRIENYEISLRAIDYPTVPPKWLCWKLSLLERVRSITIRSKAPEFERETQGVTHIYLGHRLARAAPKSDCFCWASTMPTPFIGDRSKRKRLRRIAEAQSDEFLRNTLLQMPKFYVEHFRKFYDRVPDLVEPKRKVIHIEHHENIFMKIAVAKYVEYGAALYFYQPGGDFGEIQSLVDSTPYDCVDKFLTYGWKIHEKDEPSFAVRLEEFRVQYFKCPSEKLHDLTIFYNLITNKRQRDRYAEISQAFFRTINRDKYRNICLRPRGLTRRISSSSSLNFLELAEGVEVDDGKLSPPELCSRSQIIIHLDHPSTNFLECVFVDHPLLSLQTNADSTDIARPFYEFFLASNVMHESIDSLAAHLNSVNLEEWWSAVISSNEYLEFKRIFARSRATHCELLSNKEVQASTEELRSRLMAEDR